MGGFSRLVMWCLLPIVVGGCATKLSGGVTTVTTLELQASHADGDTFRLYEEARFSSRRELAKAVARDGRLLFELPSQGYLAKCVTIDDKADKPMLEKGKSIELSVRDEFQNVWRAREDLRASVQRIESDERSRQESANAAAQRLRSSPAFRAEACVMPPVPLLPAAPKLRCSSRDECLQDGAAICFTRYLGSLGCGLALDRYKVPGLLSSPGCSAAAARLAGEKYNIEDAFVDMLHGIAGDISANMRRSDNAVDRLAGLIIGGASQLMQLRDAVRCTDTFVERQLEPLQRWTARVVQLQGEPAQHLNACRRDMQLVENLRQSQTFAARIRQREELDEIQGKIDAATHKLQGLLRISRPVSYCAG